MNTKNIKKEFMDKWGWYLPKGGRGNLWKWIQQTRINDREEIIEKIENTLNDKLDYLSGLMELGQNAGNSKYVQGIMEGFLPFKSLKESLTQELKENENH